ncbi:MAG: septum formation initiator family protein [Anaerolineae bacterium]|nr:septum formation initiator family protein [Thermoflexales bacterium]MDW8408897.1 septum formation initiator family protein [Anaerolineae bacterium]
MQPATPLEESSANLSRLLIWASLILLVLSLPLLFNLMGRLQAETRAREAVEQMSTQVAEIEARRDAFKARLEYVTSEAYVEQRARVEYRLVREGEIPIIPSAGQNAAQPRSIWLDMTPMPKAKR